MERPEIKKSFSHEEEVEEKRDNQALTAVIILLALSSFAFSFLPLDALSFAALYITIFLLALSVIMVFFRHSSSGQLYLPDLASRNNDIIRKIQVVHGNRIDSLSIYTKYASKGSVFSRRELAVTLYRIIVQEFGENPLNSPNLDPNILDALKISVLPYKDPLFNYGERGTSNTKGKLDSHEVSSRENSQDRQTYLESIDRITTYLEAH